MSACRIMRILLTCGLVCQLLSTLVSAVEMAVSESAAPGNTSYDFYSSRVTVLQTLSLIDDVTKLRYMCYMLRYLGVIFHLFASCVLKYVFWNRQHYIDVKALMGPTGWFILLQLFGVVALVIRLVALFLYTIKHVCDVEERDLEPNYIMLGIATVFGFLSLLLYIGHLFVYMYNKCSKYENADRRRNKTLISYFNTCETLVDVNIKASICRV